MPQCLILQHPIFSSSSIEWYQTTQKTQNTLQSIQKLRWSLSSLHLFLHDGSFPDITINFIYATALHILHYVFEPWNAIETPKANIFLTMISAYCSPASISLHDEQVPEEICLWNVIWQKKHFLFFSRCELNTRGRRHLQYFLMKLSLLLQMR